MAFVSLHFNGPGGGGSAGFAIYFEGKGATSALESSTLFQELRAKLGDYSWSATDKSLLRMVSDDTRAQRLVAELDRIAQAFGSEDLHRTPRSQSRVVGKRLAMIAEAVLARGTWDLEMHSLWIKRANAISASIGLNPQLDTMLIAFGEEPSSRTARLARAKSHGYVARALNALGHLAVLKLQPLSMRAALAEARFLESEVSA